MVELDLAIPIVPPAEPWKRPFAPASQGAELRRLAVKTWSSISASVKELRLAGPFEADLKHDCARLSVMLDVIGDIPDARASRSRPTPPVENTIHQMNYTPADMAMWARSERTTYLSHINFTFSDEMRSSAFDEDDLIAHRLAPRLMFFDERILQLAKLFRIECNEEGPSDLLYGDSLASALLARLALLNDLNLKTPKRGGLVRQGTEKSHSLYAGKAGLSCQSCGIGFFERDFAIASGPRVPRLRRRAATPLADD